MTTARRIAFAATALALLAAGPAPAKSRYSATITRTEQGIPHIVARDYGGLGYGSGYSAAQDNGCVIADTLVTVRGERSKFFGKDAKLTVGFGEVSALESDVYHRSIADIDAFRRAQAATSRDNREMFAGFVAGYNRFLRDHPDRFAESCRGAAWLRPMSADDGLLLLNAAMTLISSAPFARAYSGGPPGQQAASVGKAGLPDMAQKAGMGSNGWAFGSDATGGGGVLVGNPHFPWTGPNRFRRLHLTIKGKLDVMGGGLVFMPTVGIGFNKDIAWTHTVTTAVHTTLFQLALDPADPTVYLVDGKPEKMARRDISIEVKDGPPVVRTLYSTRFGPAVALPAAGLAWTRTMAFALRDADQGNFRAADAWLGIARARSVEEVRDAIGSTLGIPWVNTIAADRHGKALYADVTAVPNVSAEKFAACASAAGKTPMAQQAGVFILDGTRAACDWDVDASTPAPGLMPLAKLPVLIRRDYVQNSNDSYWLSNNVARLPQHSPLLGPWGTRQNYRTRSGIAVIEAALAAPGRMDIARASQLILENRVLAAELTLGELLKLCPQRPALAEACGVLSRWDRRAEIDSRGALLFFAFWRRTGAVKDFWVMPFDAADPVNTPNTLNPASAPGMLDALQAAADEMKAQKLALDAPLGSVQVAPRGADRIAIHGGPGGAGVLNAMASAPTPEGLVPYHGSSYMQVVGFGADGPRAISMLAYSQSTDPASPWYADGTRAFSAKRWLALPFTPRAIAAARIGKPLAISE